MSGIVIGSLVDLEARAGTKVAAQAAVRSAVRAFLACDYHARVEEIRRLLVAGQLCVVGEVEQDVGDGVDVEEAYDADLACFADDDVWEDDAGSPEGEDLDALQRRASAFSILVVERGGHMCCVPPVNPFAKYGQAPGCYLRTPGQILYALRGQFAIFAALARELERVDADRLDDAKVFLERHERWEKKAFADRGGFSEEGVLAAARTGQLVWPDGGVVPLTALFK